MFTDPTEYQRNSIIEPTQTAYHNPYDAGFSYESLPLIPSPPPPPSKQRSYKPLIFVLTTIICLLIFFSIGTTSLLLYQRSPTAPATSATHKNIPTPTLSAPTPTPTVNPNYTAVDLIIDLNLAGIHPTFVEYNKTIWSFTQDTYFVSVHATSSADFTDDSACNSFCSPLGIGIWVYSSKNIAQQAYMEVGNDEVQDGSIPMMGTPPEYTYGRCLLLGPGPNSIYTHILMQNCI